MAFHPTNKAPSKYAKEKTEAEGESASAQDLGFRNQLLVLIEEGSPFPE
jgi:hypothetical protein